jgi:hypothetical protein
VNEAENFPFIVKMSSNGKKIKKQHKVFSVDKKMQIQAEVDAYIGTWVDVAAVLGLWVSALNTIVSKWSEIEKCSSCYGHSFLKNANL